MMNNFLFDADMAAKMIRVSREFNAPVEKVWRAWTEVEFLEKWIAPKPWRAETKTLDFTVGGVWLYAMVGTEGQRHWVYAQFTAIEDGRAFSSIGRFCDADGNPVMEGPGSSRETTFRAIDVNRTRVDMLITFEEESTIKMFVEGGFKEGTTLILSQLDGLLASE